MLQHGTWYAWRGFITGVPSFLSACCCTARPPRALPPAQSPCRPERHIAVVTHSSFLHFTMSCFGHAAPEAVQGELHRWYDNCEMRSLVLQDMGPPGAGVAAGEGGEVGAEAPGSKGGDEELGAGAVGRPDPWHFPGGLHSVEEEANGV